MGGPPADGLKGEERGEGQVEYIHASHIRIHQSNCGSVGPEVSLGGGLGLGLGESSIISSLVGRIMVVLKTKGAGDAQEG